MIASIQDRQAETEMVRSVADPRACTLAHWLEHCERLHPAEMDLSLDRVGRVNERLGLKFAATVVIVAGTNGKGSTCAMLEAIALAAGYRVGVYSTPHLMHFEERCRINGVSIDAAQLLPHFEAVECARASTSLTYFEFTTLVVARALAAASLDLVVLEVGLGGRLDAVNVFDADCAVITSIDLDHTAMLGTSREQIAVEKAGIMRRGKPAVVSDPAPPRSLTRYAEQVGASLWLAGKEYGYLRSQTTWHWHARERALVALPLPSLPGANQIDNAAGVLAALEALADRLPVSEDAVRKGLVSARLRGRIQVLSKAPTIVLDVAHNPHAVDHLASELARMCERPNGQTAKTHAVFGCMRDKDIAAMLAIMAPLVDYWYFTDLAIARAAGSNELAQIHQRLPKRSPGAVGVSRHDEPEAAYRAALAHAVPDDCIVVFGSFYTVGAVLKVCDLNSEGEGHPPPARKRA